MPGWLQAFANNQPITHAINAMRGLTQGGNLDSVWKLLIWVAAIIVVVVPLAVIKYRRSS